MEQIFAKISIMLAPALLAITVHEVSHGLIADYFGDPTARLSGRLTLNPLRHLDPIGTLALLVFGFGWARPVPVDFRNLRNPQRDMIWVAAAGPLANFLLAMLCALLLHAVARFSTVAAASSSFRVVEPLALMLGFGLYVNLLLGLFNLLPIPPLDGGRVLMGLLPPQTALSFSRLEPFGFVIVLVLVFFTDFWTAVAAPAVLFLLGHLAGSQIVVVEQAMRLLFGH